jgi:hypothetical protein
MIWGGVMTEEHARLIEQAAAQYLAVIEKAARAVGEPCTCEYVTSVFFIPLYSEPIFLVIPGLPLCHSEPKARNLGCSEAPRSLARATRGLGMTRGRDARPRDDTCGAARGVGMTDGDAAPPQPSNDAWGIRGLSSDARSSRAQTQHFRHSEPPSLSFRASVSVIPSRRRGISGAASRRDPSPALRAASG